MRLVDGTLSGVAMFFTDIQRKCNNVPNFLMLRHAVRHTGALPSLLVYMVTVMHVVIFSQSVFYVENLMYQPDILFSAFSYVVLCLRTSKHKR